MHFIYHCISNLPVLFPADWNYYIILIVNRICTNYKCYKSEFSDEIIPSTPVKFMQRPHCESDTDLPVPRRSPHPCKVFYFMKWYKQCIVLLDSKNIYPFVRWRCRHGQPKYFKKEKKRWESYPNVHNLVTNTNYLSYRNDLVTGDQNNKTQTVIFGTCFVYSSNMYIRF